MTSSPPEPPAVDFTRLSFPLNVYARAIALEEGEVRYLHYGLDVDQGGILAAQQRATDYLIERLPPPCNLLEVGVGLCTTARRLLELGYRYTGVTPDATQVARCREAGLTVEHNYFEQLPAPPPTPYDLILFQESAQYIHPAALLSQAGALLATDGRVIIADEVSAQVISEAETLIPKMGFEVVRQEDITARAAPSLEYLIETILKHRKALLEGMPIDGVAFGRLLTSLEARRQAYLAGRHRYLFIELRRRP